MLTERLMLKSRHFKIDIPSRKCGSAAYRTTARGEITSLGSSAGSFCVPVSAELIVTLKFY